VYLQGFFYVILLVYVMLDCKRKVLMGGLLGGLLHGLFLKIGTPLLLQNTPKTPKKQRYPPLYYRFLHVVFYANVLVFNKCGLLWP
jgi:hypothetical protein